MRPFFIFLALFSLLVISILIFDEPLKKYSDFRNKQSTSDELTVTPPVTPITTPLEALMQAKPDLAMKLLTDQTNVNEANQYGDTALIWAVNLHQIDLARALLRKGADPNIQGSSKRTALHWAAKNSDLVMSRLLVGNHAKTDILDKDNETALFQAARANAPEIISLLCEHHAPLEQINIQGDTAVFAALRAKATKALEALTLAGANLDHKAAGKTAYALALDLGISDALKTDAVIEHNPELLKHLGDSVHQTIVNKDDEPKWNLPQITKEIHDLVNEQRRLHGLSMLAYDPALEKLALGHSKDMYTRKFFNHINPDQETPTDRAIFHGVQTVKNTLSGYQQGIAENIYRARTFRGYVTSLQGSEKYVTMQWYTPSELAEMTVNGWMNSPGHRKNILAPAYQQEGIGIHLSEFGDFHVTQNLF